MYYKLNVYLLQKMYSMTQLMRYEIYFILRKYFNFKYDFGHLEVLF